MRKCYSCRHFHVGTTAAFPNAHGMCRRYAPRAPSEANGQWQAFPPMSALHSCGEHEELRQGSPATARRWRELGELMKQKQALTPSSAGWVCGECGRGAAAWAGQCRHCGQWNALVRANLAYRASASGVPITARGGV